MENIGLVILLIIIWTIGAIATFTITAKQLGLWLFNPIILLIVIIISCGSWLSLLMYYFNDHEL